MKSFGLKSPRISVGITALMCFLVTLPFAEDGGFPNTWLGAAGNKTFDPAEQLNRDHLGFVMSVKDQLLQNEYAAIGCDPGFLDEELKELTSFSIGRIQDHRLHTSPLILQRVKENSITLITYYDLIG